MNKNEIIKIAQFFCEKYEGNVQVYPTQDYYLRPMGNQYGTPSRIPFPESRGADCVFDENGDCIYVFIHTSWHNHFGGEKIEKGEWKIVPISIISLILEGSPEEDLSILANSLKQEIIDKAHPIEN